MLLARSIRPLVIAALALSAWLQARGVSALVAARFTRIDVTPHLASTPAIAPTPPRNADAILQRNPFDSTAGSLADEPAPPAHGESDCVGVRVVAIAATDGASGSLALLRFGDEVEPHLVGIGPLDAAGNSAEAEGTTSESLGDVVTIDPGAVLIERNGGRCVARMFRPLRVSVARAPMHPATPATPDGVLSTGPGSFAVDRGARDALLNEAGDWMKTVSVRPEKVGGEVIGLRVVAIQPGSPVAGLGVRAGDILQSLNGIGLNLPEKMLEALGVLRSAPRLDVVVLRDGRPTQLDYDIR